MIRLHPLCGFVLLIALLAGQIQQTLLLFALAFWHELGHWAAARTFGWRVHELVLLPFGGVLRVDEAGSTPIRQELVVALAGPAQHIVLIVICFALSSAGLLRADHLHIMLRANLVLFGFNLLPILPLDGGRVLSALASYRLPYYRVLRRGAQLSMAFGALGLAFSFALWHHGGLAINLAVISSYIIYSNRHTLRLAPYLMRRFVLNRPAKMAAKPTIIYLPQLNVTAAIHQFIRDKPALVYVQNRVLTEAWILRAFWHANPIAKDDEL